MTLNRGGVYLALHPREQIHLLFQGMELDLLPVGELNHAGALTVGERRLESVNIGLGPRHLSTP